MDLITNTGKFTKNELSYIDLYQTWVILYALACINTGDAIRIKTYEPKATKNPLNDSWNGRSLDWEVNIRNYVNR